ncbi:hypothetical protein [Corynebacterium aquilae]|uniref:Tetratricopeptide repeat protein n=1 Tax=Corynebacterium aquilae DSM 44791 TaxID=1431546 RepID=A0A1L7CGZ2_9CORY|nr:hypothetical protein [Corynebacterium aquilae]APT85106.1 hypothetical protein CAQU_08525 [Corynebacterium aquilae DSM 44791]
MDEQQNPQSPDRDLDDLIDRALGAPWGPSCSALWAQAATAAEDAGEMELAVYCYSQLCGAYAMGGQLTEVIAPFVWLESTLNSHPELFDDDARNDVGWYYKYVLVAVRSVPTVPYQQCEDIFDHMEKFYLSRGQSLRPVYIRRYSWLREMGETAAAETYFHKYLAAPRSELSDCLGCEPGYEIMHAIRDKQWEKAVELGDQALAVDAPQCDRNPEELLSILLEPWLRTGRDDRAWAAHIRAYRRYQQSPRFFESLPLHLRYLAISGAAGRPDRLDRGVRILQRHMPWFKHAESPLVLLEAATAAALLLHAVESTHPDQILSTTIPGASLPFFARADLEQPTVAQARGFFETLARDIAEAFDARPGHPHPYLATQEIDALYDVEPVPAPTGASANQVADVSGMTAAWQPSTAASKTPTSSGDTATSPKDPASQQQPYVALDVHPPELGWQFEQLLDDMARRGMLYTDMATLVAIEKIAADSALQDPNIVDQLSELQALAWLHAFNALRAALWLAPIERVVGGPSLEQLEDVIGQEPHEMEPAWATLVEAATALMYDDFPTVIEASDRACRSETTSSLAVRFCAARFSSRAAVALGELGDAAEHLRHMVNLSAAAGLNFAHAAAGLSLSLLLDRQERFIEAADVAQNALDACERAGFAGDAVLVRAHLYGALANASVELGHHETAARALVEQAQLAGQVESPRSSQEALSMAARQFFEAQLYDEGVSCLREAVHILQRLSQAPDRDEGVMGEYADALLALVSGLSQRPGTASVEDMATIEELMDRRRRLLLDPVHGAEIANVPGDAETTPVAREAQWALEMGLASFNAGYPTQAADFLVAAVDGFEQTGFAVKRAEVLYVRGRIAGSQGALEQARSLAMEALECFSDAELVSHPLRFEIMKFVAEVDEFLQ